jgi:hypothetical protein
MRSRAWLFGVVAAGVAVAVILLLWPRSTTHDSERTPLSPGDVAGAVSDGGSPDPSEPAQAAAPVAADADNNNDEVGEGPDRATGAGIRDHRGETASGGVARRFPDRRPGHVIQAPIIADLRRTLNPEIKKCSDEHAADLEPGAQIQGALRVAVHSGVVSVLDVDVQQRGVPESSGMIECARKAFASVQLRADGHAEVESHVLRLPFRIPVK